MEIVLLFAGLFFVAVLVGTIMFFMLLKRSLTKFAARQVETMIHASLTHADPRIRVLELDKTLDAMLHHLGYRGSVGDKLKKAGPRFKNINALWSAHKLRNTLAHEPGATASDADVERVRTAIHDAFRQVAPRSY